MFSKKKLFCLSILSHVLLFPIAVLVTSSCSTDETVVADSEPEVEITSVHTSSAIRKTEPVEDEKEKEIISIHSVESVERDNEVKTIDPSINPTKFDDHKITTADDISA